MKIRRKLPKPPRSGRLSYIVGYTTAAPSVVDLQTWFDFEYGGPVSFDRPHARNCDAHSALLVTHGSWHAWLDISVPSGEAEEWMNRLGWRHTAAGTVTGTTLTPGHAGDAVLHAARLARGLTLMTDGTAYDVTTPSCFNPSIRKDRPLDQLRMNDHMTVVDAEASESGVQWLYTRGLSKLGLDKIETFRPLGLPTRESTSRLIEIADEIFRLGQSPKVGTSLPFPAIGLTIHVLRHRTAFLAGSPLALREIAWEEGI
jgi:hypothetical protein